MPFFIAQGGGQAAALAVDQATSTTSTIKTATVTTTSTSFLNRTKTATASTTIATTTAYVNRTKTVTSPTLVATTTSYTNRTKTTMASTTVSTATSYVNQTQTATASTTIATTTSYVNQTATATGSTTVSTITSFVNTTATVTATSTITTSTTSTAPLAQPTGLLIPLFIYPTTVSTWSKIAALPAAYPNVPVIAIVNVNSGPGTSQDPNYVAAINSLKTAGVVTVGYVYTNYGAVSLQTVKNSIDSWKNFYGVTGIFLDAMAYTPGSETYYQSLESYAKGTDGMNLVIGNPGTETIASYIGNGGVDNIGFYENSGTPTIAYLSSTFHTTYPKTQWSFICYGVASLNNTFITQASHYVSYLYVASGTFPNPWNTIPSYLNQMAADLATVNPPTPTIKASPTNTATKANPNQINHNDQLNYGCEANCIPNFNLSFPSSNSQNILVVFDRGLRLQTPANIMLKNESSELDMITFLAKR